MRNFFYWLLPIGWMGIIFFASAQPYEKQSIQPLLNDSIDLSFIQPYVESISMSYNTTVISVESLGIAGFIEFFIRKGTHVFVFLILCCLYYVAFKQTTRLRFSLRLLSAFILTVSYAGIDEFHQGFTENRTSYIGDVFLDGVGAIIAACFIITIRIKKGKPVFK